MKNLIISFIMLPTLVGASICDELISQLSYGVDRYYKNFNITKFEDYVTSFKDDLINGKRILNYETNSKEEFFAVVRAHQLISDPHGSKFVDIFERGPSRKQRKVLRMLNGIQENKPIRFKTMKNFVSSYYYASIIEDSNFFSRHMFRLRNKLNPHKIVWDWIDIAFQRQGVEQALVDIGFMKSSRLRARFRQWSLTKGIAKEAILTGFTNAVGIKMFNIPTHLPMTRFLKEMNLSDDFMDYLYKHGSKKAWEEIQKNTIPSIVGDEFKRLYRTGQISMIYDVIAKAYNYGFVTFYFYFMFEGFPETEEQTDFEATPMDENFFDPQEVRINLFSRWRFDFFKENERFPTQDEVNDYMEEINALSDEELREIHEEMNRKPASTKSYMGLKLRAL